MQFSKFVAVATLAIVAACGGGDQAAETPAETPAAAPAEAPAAAAAVTGTTHVVQMLGDETYRFDPTSITIKQGDAIKFDFISGGPHNVAFDAATLSPEAKTALIAAIPNPMMELASQMMMDVGQSVTINFAGVPAGTYEVICTPHLAMGMKMTVVVE
jgi:plastocyanin